MNSDPDDYLRVVELMDMFESANVELDEPTFVKFASLQKGMRRKMAQSAADLAADRISPETFFDRENARFKEFMGSARKLLGDERYKAVFGDAGENPQLPANRKTFLDGQKRRRGGSKIDPT